MKTLKMLFILSLLIAFNSSQSWAQKGFDVSETKEKINDFDGNALRIEINRSDEKTISKEWKKKMKNYDGSVKTKKNEINATEVNISSISDYPIQVFAKVNELKDKKHEFLVIFLNGNQSISSKSDISGFTAAKNIVSSFANEISKDATQDYNDLQEKELKALNSKIDDLQKEKKNAEKEIEDSKKTIKEKEKEIEENEKERVKTLKKIEEQKKVIKDAKSELDQFD